MGRRFWAFGGAGEGNAGAEVREGVEDLGADLVAAGADTGADRGVGGADRLGAVGEDARRETAPAAVQHRHPTGAGERHRQAVGDEHERRQTGLGDHVPVDFGKLAPWLCERARFLRTGVSGDLGAVHLKPDRNASRVEPQRRRQAPAVLDHVLLRIVGEDTEVEAVEGGLAEAAEAGGEHGLRPIQVGLQPPQTIGFTPLHARNKADARPMGR